MSHPASALEKWMRRHPRLLPAVVFMLWLAQLGRWAAWESSRHAPPPRAPTQAVEPLPTTTLFEDPYEIPGSQEAPDCPFSIRGHHLRDLTPPAPPHETVPEEAAVLTPAETDVPPPPTPPDEPAPTLPSTETLKSWRYRGLMRTADGTSIAFLEETGSQRLRRLQVGEHIEDWVLADITRLHVRFSAEGDQSFEIQRNKPSAESPHPPPEREASTASEHADDGGEEEADS